MFRNHMNTCLSGHELNPGFGFPYHTFDSKFLVDVLIISLFCSNSMTKLLSAIN